MAAEMPRRGPRPALNDRASAGEPPEKGGRNEEMTGDAKGAVAWAAPGWEGGVASRAPGLQERT